jgi:hypothetical protein
VCSELDAELVVGLEALQRYMDAQVAAADVWKRGFLALARARRAINSPAAFSKTFPSEITTTALVCATPRGGSSGDGRVELEIKRLLTADDVSARLEGASRTKTGPPMPSVGVAGHVASRGPAQNSFSSMSGNLITYEDDDGVTHVAQVQSPMTFSPSSMGTVNAAMFAALVAQGGEQDACGRDTPSDAVSSLKEQVVHAPRLRAPPTQHDPLKWFGVLVPQALRDGQRTFERLMPVLSVLANARADVELHSARCAELRAEKERLLEREPGPSQ